MSEASVMITIDSASIVDTYKPNTLKDNPPYISANFIYMVTSQNRAISGNGGGELNLRVRVNDIIRWRETSLTAGSDQQVLLYKFVSSDPTNLLISNPEPIVSNPTVPFPNPQNPSQPVPTEISDFFWQCTAKKKGSVTYHFQFMVTDRDCKPIGYYQWDPFITISG